MRKILVIALQEITRDLIDPWIEQGLLPNLSALMKRGTSSRVAAESQLITPISWANILTGVGANQHGIFDHWQRGPKGVFNPVTSETLQAPPIWTLLKNTGVSTTFLNVPLTWPLPDVDGIVVASPQGAEPTREIFQPAYLYDQLIAADGYFCPHAVCPGGRKKKDYLTLFDVETPRLTAAYEFLLKSQDWQFAMVHFMDAAMAQHYFWADMEADPTENPYQGVIESAYKNLDNSVGRLINAAGPDTAVFVMSECGAGRMKAGIQLNRWLEQLGLLHPKNGPLVELKRMAENRLLPVIKPLLPDVLKTVLGNGSSTLRNWASSSGSYLDLEWKCTQAFSRKEGNIYINLEGRDPFGIVKPGEEYDALLRLITEALKQLVDPKTGKPVVARVTRPDKVFYGSLVERAPDLMVEWTNHEYMVTEQFQRDDAIFVDRMRKGMNWPTTGSHRHEGVLIAAGPGIRAAGEIDNITQFDLLPTWLRLLNQTLPDDLEGRVLMEMMEP